MHNTYNPVRGLWRLHSNYRGQQSMSFTFTHDWKFKLHQCIDHVETAFYAYICMLNAHERLDVWKACSCLPLSPHILSTHSGRSEQLNKSAAWIWPYYSKMQPWSASKASTYSCTRQEGLKRMGFLYFSDQQSRHRVAFFSLVPLLLPFTECSWLPHIQPRSERSLGVYTAIEKSRVSDCGQRPLNMWSCLSTGSV